MSSPSDNEFYDDVEEEFTTPSRSGENSDHPNLDWESDQERFSFEIPPGDLQQQLGGVPDWPPRHLSSETDNNFLEASKFLSPDPDADLDTVHEEILKVRWRQKLNQQNRSFMIWSNED